MRSWVRITALSVVVAFFVPVHEAHSGQPNVAEYEELLKIQEAEYERFKKMRQATIDAMIGANLKYPGVPNGWDDFSISSDVNDDAQCAYSYYDPLVSQLKRDLDAARKIVRELRNGPPKTSPPRPTTTRTRPPSTAGTTVSPPIVRPPPTGRPPPPTAGPPTAAPPTASPPKKDMNCLCRCSCAAAGFNVANVNCYYSTAPVKHVNPNGDVSESCMQPSQGPCVCQGYVCRRASLVSSGSCADGCAR